MQPTRVLDNGQHNTEAKTGTTFAAMKQTNSRTNKLRWLPTAEKFESLSRSTDQRDDNCLKSTPSYFSVSRPRNLPLTNAASARILRLTR